MVQQSCSKGVDLVNNINGGGGVTLLRDTDVTVSVCQKSFHDSQKIRFKSVQKLQHKRLNDVYLVPKMRATTTPS